MGFGQLLKQKMDEKGIRQAELSEATGIPKTTLSGMITRDISKIEIELFLKICKVLDCDPEEFYDEYVRRKQKPLSPSFVEKYNAIDDMGQKMVDTVLNLEYERCISIAEDEEEPEVEIKHSTYKVSAGTGFELGNDDDWETISIPDSANARKADFALTIKGDSMEPVYFDGDIVLVKEQDTVDIGEIGIFTIEGEGYIKKYGGDRLISLNAEYDDIIFAEHDEDSIRCVGKVIGRA